MTIDVVPVALGARSYDVRIGPGLIGRAGAEIAPFLKRPRVAVVTDDTVAAHHLLALAEALQAPVVHALRGEGRSEHLARPGRE